MIWKGLTLRTIRSEIGIGFDELLEDYDEELQLLILGGIGRCFTSAQAIRFLKNSSPSETISLLESMSACNRLLCKYTYKLANGIAEKKTDYVYTISEGGVGRLSHVVPTLLDRLQFGKLEAFERRRMGHSVGVTQAILTLRDQYQLLDVIPERMVRAELRRENNKRLLNGQARLALRGIGDLIVELRAAEKANPFWLEIEISNKNTSKDLKRKDKNLLFYCSTPSQLNKVKRYTGTIGHLLGDPFSVEALQSSDLAVCRLARDDDQVELCEADVKVYEVVKKFGGMATTGAVSALLRKAKSTVNESLRRLFKAGFIRQAEITLVPGLKSGRPSALYLTDHNEKIEHEDLRKGLLRALTTQFLIAYYGHKFSGYDEKKGILATVASGKEQINYHIFFDDVRRGTTTIVEEILHYEKMYQHNGTQSFRIIIYHERRLRLVEEELKNAKSKTGVVNIFHLIKELKRLEEQEKVAKKRAISK
jgi:predicted transcriptional regulator